MVNVLRNFAVEAWNSGQQQKRTHFKMYNVKTDWNIENNRVQFLSYFLKSNFHSASLGQDPARLTMGQGDWVAMSI